MMCGNSGVAGRVFDIEGVVRLEVSSEVGIDGKLWGEQAMGYRVLGEVGG